MMRNLPFRRPNNRLRRCRVKRLFGQMKLDHQNVLDIQVNYFYMKCMVINR